MEGRRRITLYDQMTAGNSSSRDSLATLMLGDVVFNNQNTVQTKAEADESHKVTRSRTLQDIIREDQPNNSNNHNNTNEEGKDRKSWKALKDKLWLKRGGGSAWSSAVNNNNTNYNDNNNGTLPQTRHDSDVSTQRNSNDNQRQNDIVEEDANISDPIIRYDSPVENAVAVAGDSFDEENGNAAAAAVSLMDLLEETEQEMDLYRMSDDDDDVEEYCYKEEEEKEEEEGKEERSVVEYNCCVCMVRHKGAAFIPCGHTFCRLCSREIWVNRGNCPLCNNLILEILDIF